MALNNDTLVTDDQLTVPPFQGDEILDPSTFVLPPNSNGNSIENNIDNATIGQFSPNGAQVPDSDVQFIQSQINPLGGQAPAIAGATNDLFMPGFNQPLRVGGTSGQLTGSRDIFVAGTGFIPFAALERRREAQQKAALKRAEDLGRFKLKKPALSKDPRFNRNLVDTANDFTDIFIKRAEQQFGSREAAMAALTSPSTKIGREFAQQMDNLEILAGEVDQVVDLNAEVEKAIEEGDQYVSDDTLRLHNEFKNLSGKFTGGDAFGAASFRDKLNELQTSQSVDQYFKENETLKNIEGEILQTAGVRDRGDNYLQTTRYQEDFSKGARAQAKAIKQNAAFRNREITEDQIFDRIMALKGKVDKRTATVKNKPKQGDGYNSKDQVPVSKQPKLTNIGNTQVTSEMSVPYSRDVQTKEVNIDGVMAYDEEGNLVAKKGLTKIKPVENSVIDIDGIKHNVVMAKEIINVESLSSEEKSKLGISPLSKQKTIERDIVLDYDNVKSSIGGLTKGSKFTTDAFDDVASQNKRDKIIIDKNNFDSEFKEAYLASGYTDVKDFISAARNSGIDIVLNESSKEQISSQEFMKESERQRMKRGQSKR